MAITLNNAFRTSVLDNASDALKNQILLLMANIDVDQQNIVVPAALSEPRLSQAESDLFAQIVTPNLGVVWKSESFLGQDLPINKSEMGEFVFRSDLFSDTLGELYGMTFAASWETDEGDLPFTIQVAQKQSSYQRRLDRYQRQLALWLGGLGVGLILLLWIVLSWALNPLARVTRQVGEIEQGKRSRFDENYPDEVSRLTQNLNQLLNFEQQRIDRQKHVLGNLAHSLKTPIAILSGLEFSDKTRADAQQQIRAMQNTIDYQLQSASAVGRRRFAKPIAIEVPTRQLMNSLDKLYADKRLSVTLQIPEDVLFYGDEGDWMELIGNLLDNAYKWASSKIEIEIENITQQSHRPMLSLLVRDDGPGIDQALRQTILDRGVRLDSQTPGHGLGLHIVKGIVEAYDGEIDIENRQPCGTQFRVLLR